MKDLEDAVHKLMLRLAHDVRNPLAVILSNLRYLEHEVTQADLLEAVEETLLAAEQTRNMIDDVVDLQRLQDESWIDHTTFDLEQLDAPLHCSLEPRRGKRTLQIDLPKVRIKCNKTFLQRALNNILEHGLKQTPSRGAVSLTGEVKEGLTLWITDQGLPFNPDVLPSILAPTLTVPAAAPQGTWRSDQGLAIHFAGKALRAIGAAVETSNREQGVPGVIFSITFPRELVVE